MWIGPGERAWSKSAQAPCIGTALRYLRPRVQQLKGGDPMSSEILGLTRRSGFAGKVSEQPSILS